MENLDLRNARSESPLRDRIPVTAERLLDLVPDFVGVADADGRWLYINRPGRNMVGLAEDAAVSTFWIYDFFPQWTVSTTEAPRSGGVNWSPNGALRTRQGREVRVSNAVVAHRNGHSEITCFAVIARGAFAPAPDGEAARRVDVDEVLRESLAAARVSLDGSVRIVEFLDTAKAAVFANPTQIRHMVMNLCLSSAQSMCEGGGEISVSTSKVAIKGPNEPGGTALRAGSYVRLTIRDNGPGIEPAIAPHIFDPGVAGDHGQGSNEFGMWNVKRTVIDSGGDIFVETAPGRGTAFHVYLPIVGTNGNGSVL